MTIRRLFVHSEPMLAGHGGPRTHPCRVECLPEHFGVPEMEPDWIGWIRRTWPHITFHETAEEVWVN